MKKAEDALRENEAILRLAQQRAGLVYWYWEIGRGQHYVWTGDTAGILERLFARLPSNDAELLECVDPRDRARVAAEFARSINGEAGIDVEYRILRPDGGIAWVRELDQVLQDDAGKPVRMIATIQDVTTQKATEQALRDSEARLRGFLDNTPVEMLVKDLDSRYLMINRCAERLWGRPASDFLGRRASEIEGFVGAAIAEAMDREAIETGEPVAREIDYSGGGTEWRYDIKFPIRDSVGKIIAVGGVGIDIADRKIAELGLKQSEALLREVVTLSNIGIFDHRHDADTIYWSPEQRRNYGFSPDEPVTLAKFLQCVHPEDGERIFSAVQRAHDPKGNGRFDVQHRITRPDGAIRWLDTRSQTFFEGEGAARRPARTIGAVVDITDRKLAELALRDSEARLRRAQRQARLAYWNRKLDSDVLQWAPGTEEILGAPEQDFPTKLSDFLAIIDPADRERMALLSKDIGGGLDEYTADYRILRPDGKTLWIREFGEVVYDGAGKRDSIAGTMQDITEIQALESQLRQMQKMEAIGQLSGGIAHDFNNLLGIILGNLELVRDKQTLDAPSREKIEIALHATRRGAELTHRLLAFARLQPLAPRVVQVNDLILGMKSLLQRPLGPTIEILMQSAPDLWPSEVDPAQLETTLLNLALNARDAMPQGGNLTIATANVHLDEDFVGMNQGAIAGDYVRISVHDTGVGMSEPVRARAFDPFFTTKKVGKGTGLGLSMVYGFVKQSGGYIKLHSEAGHGTTVNIYLPRSHANPAPAMELPPPAQEAMGDATILVVEDELDILSLAVESLEGWGYKVLTASDGTAALAALEANAKIDFLLTDVILPGPLDGRAIAEKACARHPGLKVVYMSGYTPNSILHGGALDPGVLHIGKPFRRADLARILQMALKRSVR